MVKSTILIIEDNPTTRKMLRVALESDGYAVLEAENGEQALEWMTQSAPALILQDLLLPDMDGFELNRRLRNLPNGDNIPILAISGFLHTAEQVKASDSGFTAILIKPIIPSQLLETIESYLPLSETNCIGQGRKVLIVDDDQGQIKLLSIRLKQVGFSVDSANNGEEALTKAFSYQPDAIVSDILMPRLDGFELCTKIRQDRLLAQIPVLLISSNYFEEADFALAKKVGANAYITRTPDFKQVIDTLAELVNTKCIDDSFSEQSFKDEHIRRLIWQLERQINANTELAQRCSLQSAQLNLLRGVADSLTQRKNLDIVLHEVLGSCLDAAGISKGVLYLKDKNADTLSPQQLVGYTNNEKEALTDLFGQPELLADVMERQEIVQLPSEKFPPERMEYLLKHAGVNSGLIIPLISMSECLGVLFLGSNTNNIANTESMVFARTLGVHIAQTLALAETFERLIQSEQRYRTLMESASCGIFIHDENAIILEVNKQCEAILHSNKDQLIGKDYRDFVLSSERDQITSQLRALLKEKRIDHNECHIKQRDGSITDVEMATRYVEIAGEPLFLTVLSEKRTAQFNLNSAA